MEGQDQAVSSSKAAQYVYIVYDSWWLLCGVI